MEWLIPFIIGTIFGVSLSSTQNKPVNSKLKELLSLIIALIYIFFGSFAGNLFAIHILAK